MSYRRRLELGERDRPVVVFTVGGRSDYLKETLVSWAMVRGAEEATFVFLVEPGQYEALMTAHYASTIAKTAMVIENKTRLGVTMNPWHAMQTGFRLADFVILAEEDTPVSTDVLEYFAWARANHRPIGLPGSAWPRVAAICGHQIGKPLGSEADVLLSRHFSPVVWGTWKETWESFFRDDWGGPNGWDAKVNAKLRKTGGQVVIPAWSRSQHIGEHGTHCTPGFFPQTESQSWQPSYGPQAYRELDRVQREEGK